ncbi:MAG TPA: acyl-CoA thioesterase domain-containing protein, partial [Allosphingosinicella sp.]
AVTLDCQVQFIAPARLGLALDAAVELIKETRRLAFLRGLVEQDGITIAAFSGTLRKASERA